MRLFCKLPSLNVIPCPPARAIYIVVVPFLIIFFFSLLIYSNVLIVIFLLLAMFSFLLPGGIRGRAFFEEVSFLCCAVKVLLMHLKFYNKIYINTSNKIQYKIICIVHRPSNNIQYKKLSSN